MTVSEYNVGVAEKVDAKAGAAEASTVAVVQIHNKRELQPVLM